MRYLYLSVQSITIKPGQIISYHSLSNPLRLRSGLCRILQLTFIGQSSIAWCFLDAGRIKLKAERTKLNVQG